MDVWIGWDGGHAVLMIEVVDEVGCVLNCVVCPLPAHDPSSLVRISPQSRETHLMLPRPICRMM
jgi:hypothetical protein